MKSERVQGWVVRPMQLRRSDVAELRSVLSPAERERAARYRRAGDRLRSIVARGVARQALTRFEPRCAPGAWEIEVEENGRPVVADGPWFSVTHTPGLVAVAVANVPLGIDAESRERSMDFAAVGRRWLHPDEWEAIDVRGIDARRRRFFQIWTMKEAYSKALGLGLKLNLKSFRVQLGSPVTLCDEGDEPLHDWSFELHTPTPEHILALAVKAAEIEVRWHRWG